MKKQTLLFTLTGLTCLIWSNSGLALGDSQAETTGSAPVAATPVADPISTADDLGLPWFTGPLLAGSGNTLPAGHINIEPYVFSTKAYGSYNGDRTPVGFPNNFYTISPTMVMTIGVTSFMDVQAVVPYDYNRTNGQSNGDVGDSTVSLGFQLLKGVTDTWKPSLRGTISETVPTGNYEDLDPTKNGTDATGTGAYQTSLGLNFQQLWHVASSRYLRDRLSLGYTFPSTTNVQGINTFGGTPQTSGDEKLGSQFSADLAFEYTLTNHWVPALDILYTANSDSTFTGTAGTNAEGLPAIENGPSGDELSFAPAMEYNFNSNLGIIAGPWFSVAGRNATQFTSAVVAVNYYQ